MRKEIMDRIAAEVKEEKFPRMSFSAEIYISTSERKTG